MNILLSLTAIILMTVRDIYSRSSFNGQDLYNTLYYIIKKYRSNKS